MDIRSKVLLSFIASFVLIGSISLYVLQLRLSAEFDALEQTEVKAAVSRTIAVSENIPTSLLGITYDWAVWSEMEMYRYALRPGQFTTWVEDNIDADSVLNMDMSFIEVLGPRANLILSSQSGQDGVQFSLTDEVRQILVQRHAVSSETSGCFFLPLAERFALVCASAITSSAGDGPSAGVLATARVFSDKRMRDWQSKNGSPSRLIRTTDMPQSVFWSSSEQVGPHIGMGRVASITEADTTVIYLPLLGITEPSAVSLELRVPRTIHAQSQYLSHHVLAQTLFASFATALLLALVVHLVLVKRLRSFHEQLSGMTNEGIWSRRLVVAGNDEIGRLARDVNGLLNVIEAHVNELTNQTMTDPLTGLSNRRAFDLRLALEFARGQGEDQMLALLFVDVDCFKLYNDRYGHLQGDEALKVVADVLKTVSTRPLALAARTGGEEFVLMLPATTQQGAEQLASNIHRLLADKALPHTDSTVSPMLTVSIGAAFASPQDDSPASVLKRADRALYQAKSDGRNRSVFEPGVK